MSMNKDYDVRMFEKVNDSDVAQEEIFAEKEADNYWIKAMKTLFKNKFAMLSLFCIVFFIVMALLGPLMNDHSYKEQDLTRAFLDRKSTRLNSSHVAISYAV